MAGLPESLEGLSIAHLADFHLGRHVSREQVRRAVQIANAEDPDLIVLAGDFVTGAAKRSAECAEELAALSAPLGVFAVLGNHDNWTNPDLVAGNLRAEGITVLRDELATIEARNGHLWLIGVEDTGYMAGVFGETFADFKAAWDGKKQRLATMLRLVPADAPRILLVHNPDFTEMLPDGRIDLALCGHTHGGQVRVPFLGAPVMPSFFGDKFAGGLVQGRSTLVYVNRGVSLIARPVRFNCRPEVTPLRLRRA